jgi:uncharacterized protein (TIGR02145 family)
MKNLIPILLAVVVLSSGCDPEEFEVCGDLVSHEGYDYSTVQIGDQCWFAENCRYLPAVSPSTVGDTITPYYYVHGYEGNDVSVAQATSNYETYGVLYNWPAVMTEGICPSGWHIPSDAELTQLSDFLGDIIVAGGKMKEQTYDYWDSPNTGGTNSSGFTALPGGYRSSDGFGFYVNGGGSGNMGLWWSSSEAGYGSLSKSRTIYSGKTDLFLGNGYQFNGFSARCVRD